MDPRASLIETTRKSNVSQNLFQILSKYIEVDQFLHGITDIVRRVNTYWNDKRSNRVPAEIIVESPSMSQMAEPQRQLYQK